MKDLGMQKGFTVIELVIVIVVIGILATIGILSYGSAQKKAYDASVQSDLESISGELEAYRARVDTANPSQQFPRTKVNLESLEIQATKNAYDTTISYNMIYCITNTGADPYQGYKLIARSKSGSIYLMTQDGFQTNTFTASDLTSTLCSTLGMGLVSNGMYAPNTWQDWVHTGQ
ncbi:MAG: ral secretion pathway protein [Candidatus Saccharibacteria bacterium]|nr:ral secretion pathway protein [Candidatus Saccharibacteria bacterium]